MSTTTATVTDIKSGQPLQPEGAAAQMKPRQLESAIGNVNETLLPILQRIQALRKRPLFVLASSSIDTDVCRQVHGWRRELRKAGTGNNLDVLIFSPGGELSACYVVARLLSRATKAWQALIPGYAASGATLICLGSEVIIMTELGHLGPLDPQVISKRREKFFAVERQSPLEAFQAVKYLRQFSLESLDITMKFLLEHMVAPQHAMDVGARLSGDLVRPIIEKIDAYDLGAFSLDSSVSIGYCKRIALPNDSDLKTQREAKFQYLVEKYPAHEFIIDVEEARSLGLSASVAEDELDDELTAVREQLIDLPHYNCIGLVPPSEEAEK